MTAKKQPARGSGHVRIEAVEDGLRQQDGETEDAREHAYLKSEVVSLKHTYPFRFLIPENTTALPCRWIYPLTFGGGLVGGDKIKATFAVGRGCACVVTSQESTKIYHCHHSHETRQHLQFIVGDLALLCVLPDPVVCFQGADFHQMQIAELSPSSNLVFVDWMLSGRTALSESWSFKRYLNHIEVRLLGDVVLRELTELEDTPHKTVADGMMGFQVCGMCIVLGERVGFLSKALTEKYGRKLDIGEKSNRELVVSVSEISYSAQGQTISGCYLRFLASSTTLASKVIRDITSPLLPVLGADPYQNKL